MKEKKKKTTIAIKLSLIVVLMLTVSNLISMILLVNQSRTLIRSTVQNGISCLADSMAEIIENEKEIKNTDELTYDDFSKILGNKKLNGVESSYVYVVSSDGTMLYHPSKEKVGNPVENIVVKSLVEEISNGKHPDAATTDYEYNGIIKYASYVVLENNDIVVVSADESDALYGIYKITNISGIILIGIIGLALIISIIFSRSIARPLIKLSHSIQDVAGGNLNCDFSYVGKSNDEIGQIRDEMQGMTNSLHDIVSKIRSTSTIMANNSDKLDETSNQTLAANEEISRAIQDVAEGSTNMAATITDINTNLLSMSEKAQVVDESVINIKEQTKNVQGSSQSMNQKLCEMQKASDKMAEGITAISDKIKKVNDVVDRVTEIISVIEGISGQTNLLSLNASIEAARAGDAGRGFAVVAEEIRVLSDNTKNELGNIKNITAELVSECYECMQTSEEVVSDNQNQKTEINSVINEFDILNEQINMTAEKAENIRIQMEQIVKINGDITDSSTSLTDVSSANAAATEEMTANIEELNAMMTGVANMAEQMQKQSLELNEILSFFN